MANIGKLGKLGLHKPAKFFFAGFFVLCSLTATADERLEKLDDLKVVDVAAFRQQLAALERESDTLSPVDQNYFRLLQGYNLLLLGDFRSAQSHLESMLQSDIAPDLLFRVKALLINVQAVSRNYHSAFLYLEEISRDLPQVNDTRAKEHGLSVIAYTYNQLEEFDIAKYYSQTLVNTATSERARCHANHHLLESLYGLQNWPAFNELVENAVEHCLTLNEHVFANLIRVKRHSYLLEVGDVVAAERYYASYKNALEKVGYPMLIASASALAAKGAAQQGQYEKALQLARNALLHLDTEEFTIPLVNAYYALYKFYELKQDFGSALQFYIKYSEAAKANSDNRFIQQQAYHTVRAEIEVKNQRIAMLDKDNEVLSLQKDLYEHEAKQNRLVVLILAFVLVIATTLAYRGMAGRKRFKKIAEYDQLTGISNRYHFNNQARIALDYCENNAKPAAVILFDLDYFKTINDMHGHATGDWALQQVVKTCRNFMRNNDVFGRIGGEEFAVVLPGCHTDKAVLLAEICRDAIAAIDSSDSGKQFPLSASFGVSGSDTSGYQLKQLLADADHAMYQAKESGRDKVAAFSDYRSTV